MRRGFAGELASRGSGVASRPRVLRENGRGRGRAAGRGGELRKHAACVCRLVLSLRSSPRRTPQPAGDTGDEEEGKGAAGGAPLVACPAASRRPLR